MTTITNPRARGRFARSDWKSEAARTAPSQAALNVPAEDETIINCDVLIVGSGIVGATYARILVDAGWRVLMVDAGDVESYPPGSHKKNAYVYQNNTQSFPEVIRGALAPASVPVDMNVATNLNPTSWQADMPFVHNGQNPEQNPYANLPGQAITRVVGGMATHWGCVVPRLEGEELPVIYKDMNLSDQENASRNAADWNRLYEIVEGYVKENTIAFNKSLRQALILRTLQNKFPERYYHFVPSPMAVERVSDTFVKWTSAQTVFNMGEPRLNFELLPSTICLKLRADKNGDKVANAVLYRLTGPSGEKKIITVTAKAYVLAAGAICNPQILVTSKFDKFPVESNTLSSAAETKNLVPNLGKYITEQTVAFCQTIFYKSLIDELVQDIVVTPGAAGEGKSVEIKDTNTKNPMWWNEVVQKQMQSRQDDPIPIPSDDPPPHLSTLVDSERGAHYHSQFGREEFKQGNPSAFVLHYGDIPPSVDSRLITDWRFFGRTRPDRNNTLTFSEKYVDAYGRFQPTFNFTLPSGTDQGTHFDTRQEANYMLSEMTTLASAIGGFLPGSEPQFLAPGTALHLAGTHRAGVDPKTTVVDTYSKAWYLSNLFLGGVGNIPTAFASNPTLTAMAYAVRSAESIKTKLGNGELV